MKIQSLKDYLLNECNTLEDFLIQIGASLSIIPVNPFGKNDWSAAGDLIGIYNFLTEREEDAYLKKYAVLWMIYKYYSMYSGEKNTFEEVREYLGLDHLNTSEITSILVYDNLSENERDKYLMSSFQRITTPGLSVLVEDFLKELFLE